MEYISGEEYCRAQASNAYSKANDLEKQVKELTNIIRNLQLDINLLKNKIKDLTKQETEKPIYYEDDTWFHPFED